MTVRSSHYFKAGCLDSVAVPRGDTPPSCGQFFNIVRENLHENNVACRDRIRSNAVRECG
jgi:hypothetical protein